VDDMTSSRFPVRAVTDRLVITDETAWAWFSIPTVSYEFLSVGERDALLATTTLALAGLSGAECHLLAVPDAYAVDRWATELDGSTARPAPGWSSYLAALTDHLAVGEFWRRRIYFGVLLGRRSRSGGPRQPRSQRRAGLPAPTVMAAELDRWQSKADPVERVLAGSALRAGPVGAAELRWLVRRSFWRGLEDLAPDDPAVPVLTRAEADALAVSRLRNSYRSLVLRQDGPDGDVEAHMAFLAASRFPDVMTHPGSEWLYHCEALGFPVEASVRFRLVPPRQASQDAARKLAEASDQARHISGTSADLPLALLETTQRARQLEYAVTKEGLPLSYGWPRFAVAAPSARELEVRVGELIETYRDLGIELTRPGGDQLSLMLEAIPGDRVRIKAYEQRQALVTLAAGMFMATTELGDGAGPYIGETTGRTRGPVHFDPLRAAQRNLPTAVAITGQPGAGKTHLAELLLYQLALRGAWGLMIDPKDEADGLAGLPGIGNVRVLRVGAEQQGLLDPFAVAEDRARGALLAADVLRLLVPGDLSAEHEAALLEACRLEADALWPSLNGVADRLVTGSASARQLGETIRTVGRLPLARLCFASFGGQPLVPDDHLTILQLQGLSVPDAGTPTRDYTLADRLSVAVMYLVTVFAGRLADASRSQAKAIVIDEAWALTASRQGRSLVQRLARTGRSKNTALLLVSQNAADFLGPEVQNNFSAKFAFRSTQAEEVGAVCRLLGVEPTAEHERVIRTLGNGECVFSDPDGRVGTVQVDLVLPELAAAFDTTPHALPPSPPAAPPTSDATPEPVR
jgi:hypothetical protein